MPTVSVSIRNEDYDKWRALESPAEFIHNALNPPVDLKDAMSRIEPILDVHIHPKPIKTPKDVIQTLKVSDFGGGAPIPKSFSARKKK